jgi:hypothetical protein
MTPRRCVPQVLLKLANFRCWHLGDMATGPDDVRSQG